MLEPLLQNSICLLEPWLQSVQLLKGLGCQTSTCSLFLLPFSHDFPNFMGLFTTNLVPTCQQFLCEVNLLTNFYPDPAKRSQLSNWHTPQPDKPTRQVRSIFYLHLYSLTKLQDGGSHLEQPSHICFCDETKFNPTCDTSNMVMTYAGGRPKGHW